MAQGVASARAPAAALNNATNSQVQQAIARGMPASQATAAGKSFATSVAKQMSAGVPPAQAVARAAAIFKVEAGFPKPTPQSAAVKGMAATGNPTTTVARLTSLSGATTKSGGAAFEQRLGIALATGANSAQAVAKAQVVAQHMDALAKVDATPRGALVGTNSAPQALPRMAPAAQQALGNFLARGMSIEQASAMANAASTAATVDPQVEARNPLTGIATGNPAALKTAGAQPAFDKAVGSAMLQGVPVQVAIERAQKIDTEMQQLASADKANPLSNLSSGAAPPPAVSASADRALSQALVSGKSAAEAQLQAQKIAEALPPEKPTAANSLASGKSIDSLINSPGNSRTFQRVMNRALARGQPLDQALAMARRAEAETAIRVPLRQDIADMVRRSPASVTLTNEQGTPVPSWLKFDAKTNTVLAYDPPPGALPIRVRITAGNQQAVVQISESKSQSQ